MNNLSNKALLVSLSIKQWSARKFDKKVTKEVEAHHNTHNAGRYNKSLIAEGELKKINSKANELRSFHYDNTLPWGDNGERLLPTANYFDYVAKIQQLQNDFFTAVNTFLANYPELKADAKIRLNGMYNEADYPKEDEIKSRFAVKVSYLPVQNVDDFRVSLNEQEVELLRSEIEEEIQARQNQAVSNLVERLKDAVKHMNDRLSDPEAVFRDTLVNNVADLVNLIPKLNISDDQSIDQFVEEAKALIVNPEVLRHSHGKRKETAERAKELASKLAMFGV